MRKEKARQWYVMLHLSPLQIDKMLQLENITPETPRRSALEYFIPFRFLSHVAEGTGAYSPEEIERVNALRDDFRHFVFIHTTGDDIRTLINRRWNRISPVRLRHYRDFEGRPVVISDKEMQLLIRVFSEHRLQFSIGLPVPELFPTERVVITDGMFKGQEAEIVDVVNTADGIHLTLAVELFAGTKALRLPGITEQHIRALRDSDDIIGVRFVNEAEASLLDILSRRVHHKDTPQSRRSDDALLNHLFLYSYITINNPHIALRFQSLMLLCATLRHDTASRDVLAARLRQQAAAPALTLEQYAYLHLALYVATGDADHRTAAKNHLRQLSACPEPLRRFMALVKPLRFHH